ncbi:unnamed protein product [Effrenium voratum]|nr:unnamed protein product [Effrenium voratum]
MEKSDEIDSKIHSGHFTYEVPPRKIACGVHHSVAVTNLAEPLTYLSDNSPPVVYGWGRNVYNVIGCGDEVRAASTPTKIDCHDLAKLPGIYEVACGHSHTLFLRKNRHGPGGEVFGSGLGNRGRQGYPNPNADEDDTPEVEDIWFVESPRHIPIGSVPIVRVVCGADHSLVLDLHGLIYAWGMNGEGQCGVGRSGDVFAPERVVMPTVQGGGQALVAHMAAGSRHSMFVSAKDGSMGSTAGGKVYVWGCNASGRLGLGHDRNELAPVLVEALLSCKISLVAAGEAHSGAVDVSGALWLWGLGSYGRLGLGEIMDVPLPRRISMPDEARVSQLALGSFHSVAVAGTGRTNCLYTWGYGEVLGNKMGGIAPSPLLVALEELSKAQVLQIAAGPYHTLATGQVRIPPPLHDIAWLEQAGCIEFRTLLYWKPTRFVLETIQQGSEVALTLGPLGLVGPYQREKNASHRGEVLMEDGEIITFGQGASGRLGTGSNKNQKVPAKIGPYGFATKLKTEGERTAQKRPLEHPSEKTLKKALSSAPGSGKQSWEIACLECGDMFSCAVTWHGALYTWGSGARGQLGTGSLQDSWVPKVVRMPSGRLVKSVACGREHCIAVTYDGNAYAWGKGDKGQLGVGRNEDTATPKAVGITNALCCAAGEDHSGAICRSESENELYMWGASELGKLGLGSAQLSSTDSPPACVRGFGKADCVPISLSCGQYHTAVICARKSDTEGDRTGRVWTFGGGWFGKLGHNDMENQYEPKLIQSLVVRIRSVHCGAYHSCALSYEKGVVNDNGEMAGDLWVWGRNRCICEHENAKVPIKFMQIDGQPKVTCVATSDMTTMLVTSAGLVYAWGDNRNGQIGLEGGKKESPQPEIIGNLPQPPILMCAGPGHMVVYARNKAMLAWGNQSCGRLGLQEKKMEKVLFKPRMVRAEWGSIEAMSGADEEGEAGKKVTAAALATIGEAQEADAGTEGSVDDGDEEDFQSTKENMLYAITSGQKVQRFSTMQTMLREEPESNKISSLHKHEKELKKLVESSVQSLATVPEKERRLSVVLQERVEKGIVYLNNVLQHHVHKDPERDRLDQELMARMPSYEELFTVLQLQISYLASLSMTIKDEAMAEVFVNVVCAIFADLHDSRIRNLFILLLQLMTSKELEQAKHIDDVFQPNSRVFRLFSFFALHRFHFEEVIHPLMDCHKTDEQGQPVTLMGAVTYKTLEKGQTWSLEFGHYLKSPSIAAKLKEQAPQELRADFTKELDMFYDFFKVDVVSSIGRLALAPSFWSFFAFCRDSIKECQLVGGEEDEAGTEVELKIAEPLFRLFLNGIMLPLLRDPKKFGGKEVGLLHCEKNNSDGDVLFNLSTVRDAFEDLTVPGGKKRLGKIRARLKPEILRYLLERSANASNAEDPESAVMVQTLVRHYDREPRSIYVPTSPLVKFQNLLVTNVNKIRQQSGDPLDEVCRKIGLCSEALVKEAIDKAEKGSEVLHRITIQHRFLFTERSMTICQVSRCTVPLQLSAGGGKPSEEGKLSENVDVIRTLKEDNNNKVLEDLFRSLPPLRSSNFLSLKEEFEALLKQCSQNPTLEEMLSQGIQAVGDLIETETSVEEVLEAMAAVILARNRHSRYLQTMLLGLSRLPMERDRHAEAIRRGELELKAVIEHSKTMTVPDRISNVAKLESAILKGNDLPFMLQKQAARERTKTSHKVVRYKLEELLSSGKVLECFSELETVQGKVYLTMWSVDSDVVVHVGLLEEADFMLEFVKQFKIPEDVIKQLPFSDKNDTTGLPLQGPFIMEWRSLELAKLLKEVPPAD